MKILSFLIALALIAGGVALIQPRRAMESADQSIEIAVDWGEIQTLNARTLLPVKEVFNQLIASGVTTILIPPQTLAEAPLSPRVQKELQRRGVSISSRRTPYEWEQIKSVEIGYDTTVVEAAKSVGLLYFLRVNEDPWVTANALEFVSNDPSAMHARGFLFSSEDLPGGYDAGASWADALQASGHRSLLFEFRPTRAAREVARRLPGHAIRSHTIPTAEVKDLKPDQQLARWMRAVEERSCRFLLLRPGPGESWLELLARLDTLSSALRQNQWPLRRAESWAWQKQTAPSLLNVRLLTAWGLAIVTPLLALMMAWRMVSSGASRIASIGLLLLITLTGGMWVSILSWMPETRLQLTPFRGVKAAMLLPWLLSGAMLYPLREFWKNIQLPVRRLDLLAAVFLLALVGYGLLRSGNASPSWKPQAEQGIRNQLEKSLSVRPRFKEFAVGIPLIVLGFLLVRPRRRAKPVLDPRLVIWMGMIGPISIVNTFCHLHSPIHLAFQRTGMGILLGSVFGVVLYFVYSRWEGSHHEKA